MGGMKIGVLGMSIAGASLELREEFAAAVERIFEQRLPFLLKSSYLLLSTCNRVEIYFSSDDLPKTHGNLLSLIGGEMGSEFEQKLFSLFSVDCFLHLSRVTSGLESAIVGESDIQRQCKIAYEKARRRRVLSKDLHFLFQKCLKMGKDVRTCYLNERVPVSVAGILARIIRSTTFERAAPSLLFVGNSHINRSIHRTFKHLGFMQMDWCSRSYVATVPWKYLDSWTDFDVVISATKHSEFVIRDLACRTKLIFDLGVPRNADPSVGIRENVRLHHLEELSKLMTLERSYSQETLNESSDHLQLAVRRYNELFKKKSAFSMSA